MDETLGGALHGEVRGRPDCILGRRSATYAADVLCCSLAAPNSLWECFCWGNTILSLPPLVQSAFSVPRKPHFLPFHPVPQAPLINTLKRLRAPLSGEPRSPVGGWIRVYKTNWDSGWIYRHKVDVWLYNSLHGTGLACPWQQRQTTWRTELLKWWGRLDQSVGRLIKPKWRILDKIGFGLRSWDHLKRCFASAYRCKFVQGDARCNWSALLVFILLLQVI